MATPKQQCNVRRRTRGNLLCQSKLGEIKHSCRLSMAFVYEFCMFCRRVLEQYKPKLKCLQKPQRKRNRVALFLNEHYLYTWRLKELIVSK